MIFFIAAVGLCALFGMRVAKKGQFFGDYISKQQTSAINGVFTLLVFFSHVVTYIDMSGTFDTPYALLKRYLDQTVVVTFLFYSGFGIMESIKRKGLAYVKGIPAKRFLKVLFHLDLAVLLYIAANLILNNNLKLQKTLLAFTGWTSVGNSNWYIFVVLGLYAIVFLSFMAVRGNAYAGAAVTAALSVAFVLLLRTAGKDSWWYNTVLLFPTGMIFSLVKDRFDKIVTKGDGWWLISFAGIFVLYNVFEYFKRDGLKFYIMWTILFMMVIVVLTMKFKVGNVLLGWLGSHVFSIYILQRLPMMFLSRAGLADSHKYVFVVLSLAITLVIAVGFDFITGKMDKVLRLSK